ncbi:MAG: hypothetical protein AAGA03_16260 [Planctomycetota bacterium]
MSKQPVNLVLTNDQRPLTQIKTAMKKVAKLLSLLTLALVLLPSLLYFSGTIELETAKWAALAGTIGWFVVTPIWMSRALPIDAKEVEI